MPVMQQISNSCAYFTEHFIDFVQIYLCFDLLFLKTFLFNLVPSAFLALGTRLRIYWRFYFSCMTEVKHPQEIVKNVYSALRKTVFVIWNFLVHDTKPYQF